MRPTVALLLTLACLVQPALSHAQQCARADADPRAVIEEAVRTCAPDLLYHAAAVWEDRVVADLQRLASATPEPCAAVQRSARVALAKLGDAAAFDAIHRQFTTERSNWTAVRHLGLIADDRAVAALMTYMVERHDDRTRVVNLGDHEYDPLFEIVDAMRDIARRRTLAGATLAAGGPGWDWTTWWKARKTAPVSSPVHRTVADPYLRCLARKVDWGFPGAILEMANQGGRDAETTIRKFSRLWPRRPLDSVDGSVDAALARLGDRGSLAEIIAELRERQNAFGTAVRKLEFVGTRDSLEALLSQLRPPAVRASRVQASIEREFQASILQALARMVVNPPLSVTAQPTAENVQTWHDWWHVHKDRVQFVRAALGTYDSVR